MLEHVWIGGKYHSASFPTKKLAEDWSRDLEHQITQEKYFPERAQKALSHTIGELIDIYCDRIVPQKVPRTQRYQRRILTFMIDRRLGGTVRGEDIVFHGLVGGTRHDKDAEYMGLIQDEIHGLCHRAAPGERLFDLGR